MGMSAKELRERAAAGELTKDDHAFLQSREGVPVFDRIRSTVDADDVFDDEDASAYDDWTNDELRDELGNRGLETGGNKADLVARLEADDSEAE